ncbi:MAG: tRNA adenosine(34) deaminase TadA [Methylophilaceae bacterium]|jgi:tRNA(adenine34) deaminase|nr:tRNA adenosine(34) deaminase TadA [Methylophilaceae bacterium]
MTHNKINLEFMGHALEQARLSYSEDEVPVGAVVVYQDKIIGVGRNKLISQNNPIAHAEMIAIQHAADYLKNYRLINCDLYVTLEPCIMCMGAIFHARINRLFFGAWDNKTGACGGKINLVQDKTLNHHCSSTGGILEEQSAQLLQKFFKEKRTKKNRE